MYTSLWMYKKDHQEIKFKSTMATLGMLETIIPKLKPYTHGTILIQLLTSTWFNFSRARSCFFSRLIEPIITISNYLLSHTFILRHKIRAFWNKWFLKLTAVKLLEQLFDLLLNFGGDAGLMNLAFNFLYETKQVCVSDAIIGRILRR